MVSTPHARALGDAPESRGTGLVVLTAVDRCGSTTSAVRRVLATHLGCCPDSVHVVTGLFGKPELARPASAPAVEFNASRSGERCLVAVSHTGRIGVDIEHRRPIGDIDRLANMYFTPSEAATVRDLRGAQKLDAFFACWTSKEAYTKALGTGLLTPPETFEVPRGTSNATGATWATIRGCDWTLYRFEPWSGYTAAVVVAGHVWASSFTLGNGYVDDAQ